MAPSPAVLLPIIATTVCTWGLPQRSSAPPDDASSLVHALVNWANAFDSGKLELDGRPDRSTDRIYADHFVDGLGVPGFGRRTTHMAVLQLLCFEAESQASVDVARAVLHIASAGFERSLFDPEMLSVRDLGYWTLMRMETLAVWVFLMDAAAGKPSSWYPGLEAVEISPAQRAAAIGLLGGKNRNAFRLPLESRLRDTDPRIRLAASEALGKMRRPGSLPAITQALVTERHPVVSQAMVHALDRLVLDAQKAGQVTAASVETAMLAMGRSGWRTDMALVELAAEYPSKGVILPLLDALEGVEDDDLVRAVNEQASPRLRLRAWEVLSELTGFRAPIEEPATWREFWAREKDNIEIYKREKPETPEASTRATFFGIPVTGGEIAFVIDTSGSMEELVDKPDDESPPDFPSRGETQNTDTQWSRLDAARAQLLTAVQSMDTDTRYHLIPFSGRVRVLPGPKSRGFLTGVLGRMRAGGGTNIYGALFESLGADQARFGQHSGHSVDEVFLLSDGRPSSGQVVEPELILRLVRELNRYQNIRINTVFTGTGPGANFLRALAEQNGGVFVQR